MAAASDVCLVVISQDMCDPVVCTVDISVTNRQCDCGSLGGKDDVACSGLPKLLNVVGAPGAADPCRSSAADPGADRCFSTVTSTINETVTLLKERSLFVEHFTRAQVGVCETQFATVRLWVRCVLTLHLVRHTTHIPKLPFGPSA